MPQPTPAPADLPATYFDGRSTRAQAVRLRLEGDLLLITGDGVALQVALAGLHWPERMRHGKRLLHLPGGGTVQCDDGAAWDAWSRQHGRREPLVVRLQQSWRWVAASAVALALLLLAAHQWGLPWAVNRAVAWTPRTVDSALGEAALATVDEYLMSPSTLKAPEQDRLRTALQALARRAPQGTLPPNWRLVFRHSHIGPNAFALPDGTLVMTDELVELVGHDEQVLMGVLAHELGHVARRHSLRMLLQTTATGALASLVVGDFSTLLATVPAWLGQASYSRDAEREADESSVRLLVAAGISPQVMVTLFDKLAQYRLKKASKRDQGEDKEKATQAASEPQQARPSQSDKDGSGSALGIAFSSHPADAERINFFRQAAQSH